MRFLHAADLHLDTQPSGLRGYDDAVAAVLRDASLAAFEHLVQAALDEQVDACLFAGDVYDGPERGPRAQLAFRDGLERLAEAGIASFVVHGNHDPVEEGWTAVRSWPAGVTVFAPGEPTTFVVEAEGGTLAVHGTSYATRATHENLAARFRRSGRADVEVGLLHANLGGNGDHQPYAPCTVDDLQRSGLDYWALGHVHTRWVSDHLDPLVVYPGNLQGRSPHRSEQGPKGAVVVDVVGGHPTRPRFVALDVARFASVAVPVTGLTDLGDVADALALAGDEVLAAAEGRPVVVKAELVGRGPVHADLARTAALDDLRRSLHRLGGPRFLWWDRLIDRTAPDVDLHAARAADDFLGNVLRAVDAADDEQADALLAALPDLRRLGVAVPDLADPALRARAEVLAHDLLAGEVA